MVSSILLDRSVRSRSILCENCSDLRDSQPRGGTVSETIVRPPAPKRVNTTNAEDVTTACIQYAKGFADTASVLTLDAVQRCSFTSRVHLPRTWKIILDARDASLGAYFIFVAAGRSTDA
jgi:hypothetical protein